MKTTGNLATARRWHNEGGGYLLVISENPAEYMVTRDTDMAARLREHLGGEAYLESLAPSYDETQRRAEAVADYYTLLIAAARAVEARMPADWYRIDPARRARLVIDALHAVGGAGRTEAEWVEAAIRKLFAPPGRA